MAHDDNHDQPDKEETNDSPASVVFMEMMRRVADATGVGSDEAPSTKKEDAPVELNPPQKFTTPEERRQAAALEAQRLKRVQRRQERRRRNTVGTVSGLIRTMFVVAVSGLLIATILSMWTDPAALDARVRAELAGAAAINAAPTAIPIDSPTPAITPNYVRRIGIISGHYGVPPESYGSTFDPGAVCPDGLTENQVNFEIAQRVVVALREQNYRVDLLEEHDPNLDDYRGDALVSIHSNDCRDYGEIVSGFLVAKHEARPDGGPDQRLVNCLAQHYGTVTGLDQRFGLTRDMTDYHIFSKINARTPGAIMELGFMFNDREILTTEQDKIAQGVVDGIVCFLQDGGGVVPITPEPEVTAAASVNADG
jgi:N-acetylmuramoyl-L-alanine amidase